MFLLDHWCRLNAPNSVIRIISAYIKILDKQYNIDDSKRILHNKRILHYTDETIPLIRYYIFIMKKMC